MRHFTLEGNAQDRVGYLWNGALPVTVRLSDSLHFTLEDMPMLHVLARFALATIGAIVIVAFIFAFSEGMFDLGSYNWRYIRRSIVRSLTSR